MPNVNDWIEDQIKYRFFDIKNTRVALFSEYEQTKKIMLQLSLLIASERRFTALNGFDKLCPFDTKNNVFISPIAEIGRGKRQARFANLVASWGFTSPFLSNWCDAQGWQYSEIFSELNNIPVIQFSRRKEQRDRVVLFPLAKEFMGPGGGNIPLNFDTIPFHAKKDSLVWRGRYSGISCDWKTRIFWSDHLFLNSYILGEAVKQKHLNIPRYKIVKFMSEVKWSDIAFSLKEHEIKNIKESQWKSDFLLPYIKQPIPIKEQIKNKFILAIPGNDYPSSLYWSLLSNSVVFLIENEWETALDCGLEPWVHYVPVKQSCDDIGEKFEKMIDNPKLCLEIIENAHQHIKPFLNLNFRDAADYETLRHYQNLIIPISTLNKEWSFSRNPTHYAKNQ